MDRQDETSSMELTQFPLSCLDSVHASIKEKKVPLAHARGVINNLRNPNYLVVYGYYRYPYDVLKLRLHDKC